MKKNIQRVQSRNITLDIIKYKYRKKVMSSQIADNSFASLLYHFTKHNDGVPVYPYITAITGHRSFAQPGQSDRIPGFSEKDIKEAFKSELQPMAQRWRESCNGTAPFIFMTGMADGADQIAAEAALELPPELNIKIVAVLPMEEDLFVNTLDDKERFYRLMQSVSFKFVMPLTAGNIGHESELALICNETEFRRQEQYISLSRFLAVHSHVLFAFWDGIPSVQLKGGTADTVFFKLNGNTETQTPSETQKQGDLLTFSSVGPVVHLLIPRNNQDNLDYPLASDLDMSSIPTFFLTRKVLREKCSHDVSSPDNFQNFNRMFLNSQLRSASPVADKPEIKTILEKIGRMNADSVSSFKNASFISKCKSAYESFFNLPQSDSENDAPKLFCNDFESLNKFEDASVRTLAEHYAVADQMAMKFQKKTSKMLYCYSIIFCLFCFASSFLTTLWSIRTFGWGDAQESCYNFIWNSGTEPSRFEFFCLPKASLFYIASALALMGIYFYARKQQYHYRYHRFRALAEALRVQIYWRIAGMKECVSDYYRSHQIQETEWIRAAINSLDVFLDSPKASGFGASQDERIRFTIKNWVEGQRNYFADKTNKKKEEQKGIVAFFTHSYMLFILAIIFFCLPLKGDFIKLLYSFDETKPVDCCLHIFVITGLLLTIVTVITILCSMHLKFKRSKAEAKRFEQILFPFDRATLLLNANRPVEEQQLILRQLGTEAISENVSWLLTVGEQDLNLPR